MKPILEIQNIGKKFRIQHQSGGYLSLRERMVNALKFEKNNVEDFWALKDVSFSVQPGESIGIIGKNGAGKSTLLKILSKITPPTTGRIISRGRIASLLEVGTGFHPELTGRENIFFNGSLLGMKRKEIERKFDEIVDFSGVEKFLDTPLKHFSSGMQLRLAFAVAAFLEPEILILDEVLAVGDAEFQKKCLGKMQDVSKSGRTILFVSHNMAAVTTLTTKAISLEKGTTENIGHTSEVVKRYLNKLENRVPTYEKVANQVNPSITRVEVITSEVVGVQKNGSELIVNIDVNMFAPIEGMALSFQVFNDNHVPIIFAYIFDVDTPILRVAGVNRLRCTIPQCNLYEGSYYLKVHLAESRGRQKFEEVDGICWFEVKMLGETIEWGWQKDVCVYTENLKWSLLD